MLPSSSSAAPAAASPRGKMLGIWWLSAAIGTYAAVMLARYRKCWKRIEYQKQRNDGNERNKLTTRHKKRKSVSAKKRVNDTNDTSDYQ